MSYFTEILLQVTIPEKKLAAVREELAKPPRYQSGGLRMFLSLLGVSCGNTLEFQTAGLDYPFSSEYCEDDEGFVQALKAPWSEIDDIAAWVARYAGKGNRMLVHSLEANGNDFGYEFDGRGRCRCLLLLPYRDWVLPDAPLVEGEISKRAKSISPRWTTWARWPTREAANTVDMVWGIIHSVVRELEDKPKKSGKKKSPKKTRSKSQPHQQQK